MIETIILFFTVWYAIGCVFWAYHGLDDSNLNGYCYVPVPILHTVIVFSWPREAYRTYKKRTLP